MSREKLAKKIHWNKIILVISVINPLTILPQLIQIWQTQEVAGISIWFLIILLFVQCGFAAHGYFLRDKFIMISNSLAAIMTTLTILSVLHFQNLA